MSDINMFWSWTGRYIGQRVSDDLFSSDGRQIGYFAEGDEVYGCNGGYLGEVRGVNRLITNVSKHKWTRPAFAPRVSRKNSGQSDAVAKELLAGYTDFPSLEAE